MLTSSSPHLQVDDENGFIASFNKLPGTDAIRIFERSEYYTVHGQDAHFVAQTVSLSLRNSSCGNIVDINLPTGI